jgi:NADP-dependent 3-hydroxy acid dehydrogenase YdfG
MQQRSIIISGASSGIGAALARQLAGRARLLLVARRAERLEELVEEIAADGGEAVALAADLADAGAIDSVVETALGRFGHIDALVNNAGIYRQGPTIDYEAAELDALWAIHVRAPMLLTAACLPQLLRHQGTVVNVSSVAATRPYAQCGAYGACKAALEAWSAVLRLETREQGLRVAIVAPGPTDTDVWGDAPLPRERSAMIRAGEVATAIRHILDLPPGVCMDRLHIGPAT